MPLDLTGIHNEGEFHSHHYLSAVLESDLKPLFTRWSEAENARGPGALSERYALARDFHRYLLEALGYDPAPTAEALDGGDAAVPLVASLRRDGRPYLWIAEGPFAPGEDASALDARPTDEQVPADARGLRLPEATWQELLDEEIVRSERAPRWLIFLGGSDAWLVDRLKWGQGRCLRFALSELFGRGQAGGYRAMAGLLHRDALLGEDGCMHDRLDENAHRHAFQVSTDLKYGARRAVEVLANEAVWYLRNVSKDGLYNDPDLARRLTEESLVWLYRLLFLFFVEARGTESGVVPVASDTFRSGYSLESLRDPRWWSCPPCRRARATTWIAVCACCSTWRTRAGRRCGATRGRPQ